MIATPLSADLIQHFANTLMNVHQTLDLARAEAVIDEVLGPILAEKEVCLAGSCKWTDARVALLQIDLSTVKH